jgi:undecaprenyl-diphosphatase
LSYLQAVSIGLLQGVTELFPISSLGHSVLVPAWIGGSWSHLVTEASTSESEDSPYLAFIVALHVATALALVGFFWREWVGIVKGLITSLRARRITTSTERLAWLLVVATVPVGVTGLVLEHAFRTLFAKPVAASVFLTINGLILLGAERLRRRAANRPTIQHAVVGAPASGGEPGASGASAAVAVAAAPSGTATDGRRRLETLGFREAGIVGLFQTLALCAGISRSGVTMAAGLLRGLDHEDAAKFSFLLATPVILAAGVYKLPSLTGTAGSHIHGQILAGFVVAGVAAYISVKYLTRYFTTRTLTPFAIYCLVAGVASIARFA